MFTGIIESIGIIKKINHKTRSSIIQIEAIKLDFLNDAKLGDSIAINGVCLTVTKILDKIFESDIMDETLKVSSLSDMKSNTSVNLEKAMLVGSRYGGHIVSGHIDGLGIITNIQKNDIAYIFTIKAPQNIIKYLILRGSICIDGISLTIMNLTRDSFQVSIIPHTYTETILRFKKNGNNVNLEVDIISKYVERLLNNFPKESNITEEFLRTNGF